MLTRYHGNNITEEEEEEVKEEEERILLATPNPLQVLIMPSFELLSSSSLNHHNPMEYDHNEDSSTGSSTMDLVERFHRATMLHHRSPAPLVSVP